LRETFPNIGLYPTHQCQEKFKEGPY
jgi:hypothetical protein